MKQKKQTKIFFTDGACKGNPGPGGFGVVSIDMCKGHWTEADGQISVYKEYVPVVEYFYSEYCESTTNNREELKAILHVFKIAAADPNNEYLVYSDSAYAVNMINYWIWTWAKNNWHTSKNKEVENLDLVKEIYNYLTIDFFNCQVNKCIGHANIMENELADALATKNHNKFTKVIKDNGIIFDELIKI